jgi:hypothetical protein
VFFVVSNAVAGCDDKDVEVRECGSPSKLALISTWLRGALLLPYRLDDKFAVELQGEILDDTLSKIVGQFHITVAHIMNVLSDALTQIVPRDPSLVFLLLFSGKRGVGSSTSLSRLNHASGRSFLFTTWYRRRSMFFFDIRPSGVPSILPFSQRVVEVMYHTKP